MPSFDIDALRAVVTGVEQGSFARAANELGRSQSAVSMQLKKLEQQAGVPLFVREGRGLLPTEAGEALIEYARQIVALNDEAARALGAAVAPETVWLGLPQDFFDDVMPATVRAFSERHPDVHITVRAGNNDKINDEIEAGRLDGAIAFFPKGSSPKGICSVNFRSIGSRAKDLLSRSRGRRYRWSCSTTPAFSDKPLSHRSIALGADGARRSPPQASQPSGPRCGRTLGSASGSGTACRAISPT